MRFRGAIEKLASGVLGMVCVLLLVNLVWYKGVRAGAPKPSLTASHAPEVRKIPTPTPGTKDELSKYDPELKLDLLKDLQGRPMPEINRNIFEYPAPPPPPKPEVDNSHPTPPAPPPPPPITLKLIGYSEKAGGVKEAVIEDTDDIYVVHEGDTFAKKYHVLRITPVTVDVLDDSTRQTAQLPLATAPNQ
jgi:hypothetical protein